MNIIQKILKYFSLFCVFWLIGCGTQKKLSETNDVNQIVMIDSLITDNGKLYQIDSICHADSLPPFNTWIAFKFEDFETKLPIVRYIYIKMDKKSKEISYIIDNERDKFIIHKRIKY